jgi:hypothetical protein
VVVEGKIGWKSEEQHGEKRSTFMVVARPIRVRAHAAEAMS